MHEMLQQWMIMQRAIATSPLKDFPCKCPSDNSRMLKTLKHAFVYTKNLQINQNGTFSLKSIKFGTDSKLLLIYTMSITSADWSIKCLVTELDPPGR